MDKCCFTTTLIGTESCKKRLKFAIFALEQINRGRPTLANWLQQIFTHY